MDIRVNQILLVLADLYYASDKMSTKTCVHKNASTHM